MNVDTVAYVHADDQSDCATPALCSRPHVRAEPRRREHAGMPDGWRDVPMPPGVAALPTTAAGIPITYTVAWTSEQTVELHQDADLAPLLGYAPIAVFSSGRPGDGTPKLAIVDTARARRATVRGWCQICARPLPGRPSPPWNTEPRWCGWFTKGQTIRHAGRELPLIIDGWTCKPCLTYSLLVCPALVAKRDAGLLRLLRVRRAELVATRERPESVPPSGLEEIPVGMVKIAPWDFDLLTPEEVLAGA